MDFFLCYTQEKAEQLLSECVWMLKVITPGWLQGKCNSRVGNCALTSVPAVFCGEAVWVCLCKLWLHRHCFKEDLSTEAELSILTLGLPTLLSAEVQWYLTHRGSHSQESFVRLGCTWKLGICHENVRTHVASIHVLQWCKACLMGKPNTASFSGNWSLL